jgi:outer membrane immunogenic protein
MEYMFHRYQDDDFRVRLAGPAGTPFTNATNGGTATGTDLRRSDDKFVWHSLRATAAFRF